MQKLFSCMYGSRLYGTSTPQSDIDWKHIVLPPLDQLVLGKKAENKVKKTNTEKNTRNSADDVDEEYIPIQVFARHFVEGQTYALELAFAVDGFKAEQKFWRINNYTDMHIKAEYDRDRSYHIFLQFVHELRTKFLTSNIKAMMGYAVNQASLYSFKGEKLNAVRELKEFLLSECYEANSYIDEDLATLGNCYSNHSVSAGIFDLVVKYPKYIKVSEYDIGGWRMRPCLMVLEKTLPFTNTMRQTMMVINAILNKYGDRSAQASENNVDWKAMMHAVRIVDEGIAILTHHELTFPFSDSYSEKLLKIRRGEVPLDDVKSYLDSKLNELKDLSAITDLPECNPGLMKSFEEWFTPWLFRMYGIA